MKKNKVGREALDTKKYLTKFDGLDIKEADLETQNQKNQSETIVLDKWVRHDFPDMGFTSYDEVDPP
jgi:hypothetical protein